MEKDKKLIGYKLKESCLDYADAVLEIEGGYSIGTAIKNGQILGVGRSGEEKLKKAGVLDLWFEKVYEEEPKLPKIGCRKGEETERHIKYGDKNLSKKTLKQMERVGIVSIVLQHGSEEFTVYGEDLQTIYNTAKK